MSFLSLFFLGQLGRDVPLSLSLASNAQTNLMVLVRMDEQASQPAHSVVNGGRKVRRVSAAIECAVDAEWRGAQ